MSPILRGCSRCGAPFTPRHARHRWCPLCEPKGNEHRSPTTRTRPSSSTERERIRAQVLARDPTCRLRIDAACTGTSTVADHIVAAEDGGTYSLDNLQGACDHCNSVRGGRRPTPSALKDGHADRDVGRPAAGDGRPTVVGPTRLA